MFIGYLHSPVLFPCFSFVGHTVEGHVQTAGIACTAESTLRKGTGVGGHVLTPAQEAIPEGDLHVSALMSVFMCCTVLCFICIHTQSNFSVKDTHTRTHTHIETHTHTHIETHTLHAYTHTHTYAHTHTHICTHTCTY